MPPSAICLSSRTQWSSVLPLKYLARKSNPHMPKALFLCPAKHDCVRQKPSEGSKAC